jgi:hypothetical protein
VRPGGFELPTFWFVGRFCALHGTTATDKAQRNQRKAPLDFGSFRLALYPVHGQSNGQSGPAFSLLPNNQARYADFQCVRDRSGSRTAVSIASASAHIPDVPQQALDSVDVAGNVRDTDRVLGSGKNAH